MKRVHDLFLHLLLPDIRNARQDSESSQRHRPSRRNLSVLMSVMALIPLGIFKGNQGVLRKK